MKCIPPEIVADLKNKLASGEITPDEIAKMLPEEKAALKSILEEMVAEDFGVKIKPEEVKEIQAIAKKIDTAQKKLGDDIGNPDKTQENMEFFQAKKEMDDFLNSHSPAPKFKILTGTIGRGMMLASLKSPILNIGSNIELGVVEALSRRLSGQGYRGANNAKALEYMKMVNKIYQKTGYDLSRMTNIRDTGAAGERVLDDTIHSKGEGAVRKVGQVVEDIVFKQLMGAPDTAFASAHFADSVNINALRMAKGDKKMATDMMTDAMRITPKTEVGQVLRDQAILDAQVSTWTNKSWAASFSQGTRKILNDLSGDARVGDYVFPFVKTPSNVLATGIDYAGGGAIKAIYKLAKAFKTNDLQNPDTIRSIARDTVRAGLGIAGALAITSQLEPEDFVGVYDPKRRQIEELRNSRDNSIRVGNKWISTDWLGPLAVPVTAIMYARKYGDTPLEKGIQLGKGIGSAVARLPVIDEVTRWLKEYEYNKNQTAEEMVSDASEYAIGEARSRLIPSIFADVAKAVDPVVRDTSKVPALEKLKSGIPFASMSLPEKKDIFGKPIQGESAVSDILFGARVKTDKEDSLIKEISRLSDVNNKGITFTDWNKSTTKTLQQFKEKFGEEVYEKARIEYGEELRKQLEKTLKDSRYERLSDEDKLRVINGKDTDAMEKVFRKYGFRYRTAPTLRLPQGL